MSPIQMKTNFSSAIIDVDKLLLDPNNPRLRSDCKDFTQIAESEAEGLQKELFGAICKDFADTDSWRLSDLIDSMKHIGFRSIDRMVVKEIGETGFFVVLEGNRRLSSLKILRRGHDEGNARLICEDAEVRATLDKIEVLVVDGAIDENELRRLADQILGIRHHGSLLEWAPLPSAHSIHHEYLRVLREIFDDPNIENIERNGTASKRVAQFLAIKPSEVNAALSAYTAFCQVNAFVNGGVHNRYFSLIEALVTNRSLALLFGIDDKTFKLSDTGLEKLVGICQFEDRSKLAKEGLILSKPQDANKLAKLYGYLSDARKEVRMSAENLFVQLLERKLSGDKGEPAIFKALELLDAVILEQEWGERLEEYLAEAEEKLKIEDYTGIGNHLARKDSLLKTVKRMLVLAEFDSE